MEKMEKMRMSFPKSTFDIGGASISFSSASYISTLKFRFYNFVSKIKAKEPKEQKWYATLSLELNVRISILYFLYVEEKERD